MTAARGARADSTTVKDRPDPMARAGDFMCAWPSPPAHESPATAAIVLQWFQSAFKTGPSPDGPAVKNFVMWLNVAGPWDSDAAQRKLKLPPEYAKLSKAISTLIGIAPFYVATSKERVRDISGRDAFDQKHREWHQRRIEVLDALIQSALLAAEEFPVLSSGGKKTSPLWKHIAVTASSFIEEVLRRAGRRPPHFNGGPAHEVLQRSMRHIEGKERALSQLREAFRKKSDG